MRRKVTSRSRRHDDARRGGGSPAAAATTPRQKGGSAGPPPPRAAAAAARQTSPDSSSLYSPTVSSGYSSLHRTPSSVPRGSSYTPSGVTSHLGTTSPTALLARSVAAGLRGSRARELHDAKEEEVHALHSRFLRIAPDGKMNFEQCGAGRPRATALRYSVPG